MGDFSGNTTVIRDPVERRRLRETRIKDAEKMAGEVV